MSAIADLVVFDGAATPVQHTLNPISVTRENGKVEALWRENLANVPVYAQVRVHATLQKLPSGVFRSDMRIVVPVLESVSGQNSAGYTAAPKVAYEVTTVLTQFAHERSTEAQRRLCRQMATNILNGNTATSGAALPAGGHPAPQLFDLLAAPT